MASFEPDKTINLIDEHGNQYQPSEIIDVFECQGNDSCNYEIYIAKVQVGGYVIRLQSKQGHNHPDKVDTKLLESFLKKQPKYDSKTIEGLKQELIQRFPGKQYKQLWVGLDERQVKTVLSSIIQFQSKLASSNDTSVSPESTVDEATQNNDKIPQVSEFDSTLTSSSIFMSQSIITSNGKKDPFLLLQSLVRKLQRFESKIKAFSTLKPKKWNGGWSEKVFNNLHSFYKNQIEMEKLFDRIAQEQLEKARKLQALCIKKEEQDQDDVW